MQIFQELADGRTSLHVAVENKNLEAVKAIVDSLPNDQSRAEKLNRKDKYNKEQSAFFVAVSLQDYDIFEFLLKDDQIDVNTVRSDGKTPLLLSVSARSDFRDFNFPIACLLIDDQRTNVNYQNPRHNNICALHLTVGGNIFYLRESHNLFKSLLVRQDIDLNIRNRHGKSVLSNALDNAEHFGRAYAQPEVVNLLLARDDFEPSKEDSEALVNYGIKLRKSNWVKRGLTDHRISFLDPLESACKTGNAEIINLLVADPRLQKLPNREDEIEQALKNLPEPRKKQTLQKLLKDQYFGPNNMSLIQLIAFKVALESGFHRVLVDFAVEYLPTAQKNASIEALEKKRGHTNSVILQKAHKVDGTGKNILHLAAEHGHKETVNLLLKHLGYADINRKDNKDKTPLALAVEHGHQAVADLISVRLKEIQESKMKGDKKGAINWALGKLKFASPSIEPVQNKDSQRLQNKDAKSAKKSKSRSNEGPRI